MCRKILSLCLAFFLFLAIAPAAFAQEPSISDRKGTAPAEADWLDPQFDAAPDAWENTPLPVHTVRIGLSFGASAVPEAIFRDTKSQGFRIGYYDENRVFHELDRVKQELIVICPSWYSDNGLMLLSGENGALLYLTPNPFLAVECLSGDTGYGENRYAGGFECRRQPDDSMTVINVLPLESYVKGVVPYEMGGDWPAEALKAQDVCARTYVVYNQNSFPDEGFDLNDNTECQVYKGLAWASAATDAAVEATAGQVLRYRGEICEIYYFAADGGYTEDGSLIFDADHPYLLGKRDPFEAEVDFAYRRWTLTFPAETVTYRLGLEGYEIDPIADIIPETSRFGNVIALRFVSESGVELRLAGRDCCKPLRLYSHCFSISRDKDGAFVFTGSGMGHNCGMSQWGARAMAAKHGYTYRQILAFYYTGAYVA